ncbi:hypothetical protein [Mesorhizobium sp. L2C066B000]|uniref:hypothetical protein n=1 Tax=Mesorhizobium sp. L2C066B000 TaxID=1287105 RepID=UPI0003D01D92|nr:hypothetical protein [Mesorhizobium sp. L2C066B000]ESZ29439.1 hypothetical protein X732_31550 [Mesorhizobium sp. L2C066B000]
MTLKSLLITTPGLFATTKGFGVAIFEPDSCTQRLYSLQLRKQIHPAPAPGETASDPSRFDVDRFLFPLFHNAVAGRYVVDILDDARYDDEFEIDGSVFDPPRPLWTRGGPGVVLGSCGAKLRQRGDAQARSGEDVIEQHNRFDDGLAPPARSKPMSCIGTRTGPNRSPRTPGASTCCPRDVGPRRQ